MKVPRFRVAWFMAFIAVVAIEFAVIRMLFQLKDQMFSQGESTAHIVESLCVGVLPMVNVLAFVFLIGRGNHKGRRFVLGFETFGATALVFYVALASVYTQELVWPYVRLVVDPYRRVFGTDITTVSSLILYSLSAVMLLVPQLAFALIGGFLFSVPWHRTKPGT